MKINDFYCQSCRHSKPLELLAQQRGGRKICQTCYDKSEEIRREIRKRAKR